MEITLKFLGAAKSVTGSKYLLEFEHEKILIDCGLFQGKKDLRLRNWDKFPVDASSIKKVLITHAHIDHIGFLPRIFREGFSGKIICTKPTADLMRIMLMDAAKLQEEEALFAFKQGYSKHSKPQPLFTSEDASAVLDLVESYSFDEWININDHCKIQFHNAGHILGSAFIELVLNGTTQKKKIVFSGDLGRYDDPIMYPPSSVEDADILIVESTYGNKLNPIANVEKDLAKIVNEACDREGVIIIPAFAVGRTQSLIFYLLKLMASNEIPLLPIFIDSPMAINVTDLYEHHHANHKIKVTREGNGKYISLFDSVNVHFCNTRESSKALNSRKQSCIIISASGMATGGRILHHLYHRLRNECDTVLFAGYQAEGSRGRIILDGDPSVKIFGEEVPIRCQVREIHGLSAHADQAELMRWLQNLKKAPKKTFITHGESEISEAFAQIIKQKLGWQTIIPNYLESVNLFDGI